MSREKKSESSLGRRYDHAACVCNYTVLGLLCESLWTLLWLRGCCNCDRYEVNLFFVCRKLHLKACLTRPCSPKPTVNSLSGLLFCDISRHPIASHSYSSPGSWALELVWSSHSSSGTCRLVLIKSSIVCSLCYYYLILWWLDSERTSEAPQHYLALRL